MKFNFKKGEKKINEHFWKNTTVQQFEASEIFKKEMNYSARMH